MTKNVHPAETPSQSQSSSSSSSSSSSMIAPNKKTKNQAASPPLPPKGWDRCHAYLPQKRRFCRQMISPSSAHMTNNGGRPMTGTEPLYCGNHLHLLSLNNNIVETINDNNINDDGTAPSSSSPSHRNTKRPRSSPSSSIKDGLKRIPCPIDPSHTIYAHMLKKHVRICPKATQLQRETSLEYYRCNVNTGGEGPLVSTTTTTTGDEEEEEVAVGVAASHSHCHLALGVLEVFTALFPSPSSTQQQQQRSVSVRNVSFDEIYQSLPTIDHSHEELSAGLTTAIFTNRIRSGGIRHLTQQGSIVGHLRRVDLLPPLLSLSRSSPPDPTTIITTVLEMGAGRGMLGLIVAGILHAADDDAMQKSTLTTPTTKLIMVERSGSRHKADGRVRCATAAKAETNNSNNNNNGDSTTTKEEKGLYLRLDGLDVRRIKCDLAHVHLPRVVLEKNKEDDNREGGGRIAIAKHLCGVGTDLALKSLKSLPKQPPLKGCAFATCCHGVCRWDDYVGRRFLKEAFDKYSITKRTPFNKEDFDIMRRWTSGSVRHVDHDVKKETKETDDDDDDDSDDENHGTSVVAPDKSSSSSSMPRTATTTDYYNNVTTIVNELNLSCGVRGLGRACQRLIDYGRQEYMRYHLGFETVTMCHYVEEDVTPQNALLMAWNGTKKGLSTE